MKRNSEPTLYVKKRDNDILIILLCVNDLIYTGNNEKILKILKKV